MASTHHWQPFWLLVIQGSQSQHVWRRLSDQMKNGLMLNVALWQYHLIVKQNAWLVQDQDLPLWSNSHFCPDPGLGVPNVIVGFNLYGKGFSVQLTNLNVDPYQQVQLSICRRYFVRVCRMKCVAYCTWMVHTVHAYIHKNIQEMVSKIRTYIARAYVHLFEETLLSLCTTLTHLPATINTYLQPGRQVCNQCFILMFDAHTCSTVGALYILHLRTYIRKYI
jgi:hypothetical protein